MTFSTFIIFCNCDFCLVRKCFSCQEKTLYTVHLPHPTHILVTASLLSVYVYLSILDIPFKFYLFFFMAPLGLCCCMRAFSRCGEWGYSSLWCTGFSLGWLLPLWSTGSGPCRLSSCRLSFSVACGIFSDQGSNVCPFHWQVNSNPL